MFDLRSKTSRAVALALAAVTTFSALTFIPSVASLAASGTVSDGLCSAAVSETAGVTVYNSGTHCFVAFKSTGVNYTWTAPSGVRNLDYLVVAGGGGGGTRSGGGGGAGGLLNSSVSISNGASLSVSVGAGGAGAPNTRGLGGRGSNSTLTAGASTFTAIGGGGGSDPGVDGNPTSGGSGGGAAGNRTAGTGTVGQGFAGGGGIAQACPTINYWCGGGGGGAGAAGGSPVASSTTPGIGGVGVTVSWMPRSGALALGVGDTSNVSNAYFAGGGTGGSGGRTDASNNIVSGPLGGGGYGIKNSLSNAGNGQENTGGGGGGSGYADIGGGQGASGSGGSGLVVIRYKFLLQVLSYNSSDNNSYNSAISPAVNDLTTSSLNDGALITGSNGQSAAFSESDGAWNFGGAGTAATGPYLDVSSDISTTPFASNGVTIDFEADFGTQANNWERIIDFSAGTSSNNNILVARNGTTRKLSFQIFIGSSVNLCEYADALPAAGVSEMARWTISADGVNCVMYKNGAQVYTQAFSAKPTTNLTLTGNFIGRSNWPADASFEGKIRSVNLYAGALSPADVQSFTYKTVTSDSQVGGATTIISTRLTSGTMTLPTPQARPGYTFTGWFSSTTFDTKIGDAGAAYAPSANITLYGGWTTVDNTANLVLNIDGTNLQSVPATPSNTNIKSVYPGNTSLTSIGVANISRDTANSPGAIDMTASSGSNVNMGAAYNAAIAGTSISFETWYKCTSYRGAVWNILASHWFSNTAGTAASGNDWHFGIYNNKLQVNAGATLAYGDYTFSAADCNANKWMLLGFTIDSANNLQIYINGKPDGSLKANITRVRTTNALLWVGDARANAHAIGYYSRVRLYSTALNGSQVMANYNSEAATYGLSPYKTVSFNNNGGSGSMSNQVTNVATNLTANTLTKPGYAFTGWNTAADGTGTAYANQASYAFSADTTLYAQWIPSQYTVTFKANNGTSTADITQAVTGGTPVALRTNSFSKANSTFVRWSDESQGSSLNSWTNGQTISPTQDLSLYAIWADDAVITFDSNGGSSVSTIYHQPRSAIPSSYVGLAKPADPTKSGKLFGGWATAETSNNGNVENQVSWPRDYESSAASETLYAIWLDACSVTTTTFIGTGKADAALSTYGDSGRKYVRYQINTVGACVWTVPSGVTNLDAVIVGGGGGGSYQARAGGGGAGALLVTNSSGYSVAAGAKLTIQIGAGGLFNTSNNQGANGSSTYFNNLVAFGGGGGGGGNAPSRSSGAGGSSGGAATSCSYFGQPAASSVANYSGWSGFANQGGSPTGIACDTAGGTGGGGAGGAGARGGTGGLSLTKFGFELAGGGAGWASSSTRSGGGTVGGDWMNVITPGTLVNNGVANTGSGGGSFGSGAAGTVILQFIAPTYTVTYDYNSATSGNSVASADYIMLGSALTLPTPSRAGYTFAGWFSDSSFTASIGSAGGSYSPTASETAYAKWIAAANATVTFDSNGGSGTMSNQVTNLATNLRANGFTRSGYTFAGWATTASGAVIYSDTASYAFTADANLYAKWTALPNKTVAFNSNGGSGTMSSQATNVATNLTANGFTRSGYTFAGWNTVANGSGTSYANQTSYAFAADATLFAQWTAVNYGVAYTASSATSGAVPTDSANYIIGNTVAILGNSGSLTRTGYTFAGWTVASDGLGTVLLSGSTLTFSADNITLYAKWTANTYTISYSLNGATGAQANTSDSYTTAGSAVTLSAVGTMAKAGHTFTGWATSAIGTPIAGTYTTTSNVTLYAQWSINTITVTYGKGTAGADSLSSYGFINFPSSAGTGNYGTRLNLSSTIDSSVTVGSDVYTLVGWNDGSSIYSLGSSFLLQSDVTMTAVWALTHAVRYTFNGGVAANGTSAVDVECALASNRCNDQQVISLNAAPTRAGYTFAGWRDQSGADFAAAGSATVGTSSYLFYAQWTPVVYTVTYSPAGGATTPTEASKNVGDRFTLANAISRSGYDFAGWSDGSNVYGAGATYVVDTSSITMTAQWSPHVYAINYDWNGGSGTALADGSYTVGTLGIGLPGITDQVKDGYTFGGWATTNAGIAISSPFAPTASTILYAIWGSGSYSIIYAPELGTVGSTSLSVANGNTITLETPTRQGFVFDGWFTAQTGGSRVGGAGASFTPSASRTLHAHWTQASIFGIPVGNLSRLGSLNASSSATSTYSGSNANSSVAVSVPSGALPNGTSVNIDMISDNTHASGLINGDKTFILSVAVSWLASDGSVPDTASGKAITVTLNNADIKAGALIYSIQGTSVVLLGTATQDGTVSFELTQDPGIYVVATSPTAPQNASSTTTANSATISWQEPSSDGGDAITGYTVTLNTGAVCTTTGALSCTISALSAGTTYTYTVSATNSIGTSPTASGSFSIVANSTVAFDANGGSGSMTSQVSNTSASLTLNSLNRAGYTFADWNTAANGSGTAYADGATYAFSAGTILYAQWTASNYTVTYDYNGATNQNGPSSSGFTSGGSAVTLPNPTKNAFSFDGWFTDVGLSSLLGAGGFAYSPTSSSTLYAGWSALPDQTVIFDANGGTGTMGNQVTNVATALTANALSNSGYTFAGWNTLANGTGTAYADGASYAFSAGTTLYAQWALIPVAPPAPTPVTPPTPLYDRPGAPTNVIATVDASGDSITVSWVAPTANGGTAIIDYRVNSSSGMACITTQTHCTFNGVNKDVAYSFTVTANNGYRFSNPSETSNTVLIPSTLQNQRALSASASQTARGAAIKIVVTGGSTSGPIIYEVSNGTATGCVVDGQGWLTASTSGTCLVTITMLGDFTYKPVSSAPTSITFLCKLIVQNKLAVNSAGSTKVSLGTTGGSGSGAVSYAVTGGTGACVLVGNTITATKTGSCIVVATKAADDVYEAATSAPATIAVTAPKPANTKPAPVVKVLPIKHIVSVAPSGKPVLVGLAFSKPIMFGPDSAKLDAGDMKQLKAAAAYLKTKNLAVLVTGFTQAFGQGATLEILLSTSRAKAVATYLRKLGVNVFISYAGFGAYNKLSPASTDRRVELRWVAKD